jgi:hypothetical protein
LVVLPAMQLATSELSAGVLSPAQAARADRTFEIVINRFTGGAKSRRKAAVTAATILCVALDDEVDKMAAKLLVRALNEAGLSAKSMARHDLGAHPAEQTHGSFETILLVSILPDAIERHGPNAARDARQRFPGAFLVSVFCHSFDVEVSPAAEIDNLDASARSVADAVEVCLDRKRPSPVRPARSGGAGGQTRWPAAPRADSEAAT